MSDFPTELDAAVAAGHLLASSAGNIRQLLARTSSPVDRASIAELVALGAWAEFNDRFFRTLAFGTGGLRGRTIGKIVTKAEAGDAAAARAPGVPLRGHQCDELFQYLPRHAGAGRLSEGHGSRRTTARAAQSSASPTIPAISRATSRSLCAKVAVENGCDAAALRGAALDAGALLRGAAHALRRRHGPHRQPQSAARQRLQILFLRRRAGGRAACQRHHREGQRHRVRRYTPLPASRARDARGPRRGPRRGLHGAARDPDPRSGHGPTRSRACASSTRPSTAPAASSSSRCSKRLGFRAAPCPSRMDSTAASRR